MRDGGWSGAVTDREQHRRHRDGRVAHGAGPLRTAVRDVGAKCRRSASRARRAGARRGPRGAPRGCQDTVTGTGEQFTLPGIFVIRVRDGRIVSSSDYFDHLGAAGVRGGMDTLLAALRSGAGDAA